MIDAYSLKALLNTAVRNISSGDQKAKCSVLGNLKGFTVSAVSCMWQINETVHNCSAQLIRYAMSSGVHSIYCSNLRI